MIRKELPKKLMKNNFMVKVPNMKEDMEEELMDPSEDPSVIKVVAVAENCSLEVGDEVIMAKPNLELGIRGAAPILSLEIDGEVYAIFRELEVEAIW